MRDKFIGFYRPLEDEYSSLWESCIFMFDANVLLNLHRYPQGAKEEFLRVIEGVIQRIWLPHQAALEYQRNRLGVIAEQLHKYSEVRKILQETESSLNGKLGQLQLQRRHSYINHEVFLNNISHLFKEFLDDLVELERNQPDVYSDDPIRNRLDAIFGGRVGEPFSQKELDELYSQGKSRYEKRQPPGYMDMHKVKQNSDGNVNNLIAYNGLDIRREFGDLILWKQILKEAKQRNIKKLIFVTDDEKEDWWWTVESKGRRVISPRPELIEEVKREAEVDIFYMYNSEKFIEYAAKYLNLRVKPETIDQVRDIAEYQREIYKFQHELPKEKLAYLSEKAVINWLTIQYPNDDIQSTYDYFPLDIIRTSSDSGKIYGYEVKYSTMYSSKMFQRITDKVYRKFSEGNEVDYPTVIFVYSDERSIFKTVEIAQQLSDEEKSSIAILVGSLDASDKNNPIFNPYYGV